uniref:RNA polymerase beta subunit n=1 Tax=Brainea insignis TaxID=120713 RepID=A0A7D5J7A2_9MONI|nr:RNA polymerase beta subunit [Brainea insignis]
MSLEAPAQTNIFQRADKKFPW